MDECVRCGAWSELDDCNLCRECGCWDDFELGMVVRCVEILEEKNDTRGSIKAN